MDAIKIAQIKDNASIMNAYVKIFIYWIVVQI